jgi:hypothetical protein
MLKLFLGTFCAVLGSALSSICNAGRIQRATHRMVSNARQVLDATATDENDGVFLQIMAFTTNI